MSFLFANIQFASLESHCPEARLQSYYDEIEKKEKEEQESEKNNKFKKPEDPIKLAHDKLNQKDFEKDGKLPKQRNMSKLQFEIETVCFVLH